MIIASPRPIRPNVVLLRDGSAVELRPVQAGDQPGLRSFLDSVSGDSLALRFFGVPKRDCAALMLATDPDAGDFGVVASGGAQHGIVAHAGCWRLDDDRAEVAFLVADSWQGRGLGSILLAELVGQARRRGISHLRAEVLPRNHRMVDVFQRSRMVTGLRHGDDEVVVDLAVPAPPAALMIAA